MHFSECYAVCEPWSRAPGHHIYCGIKSKLCILLCSTKEKRKYQITDKALWKFPDLLYQLSYQKELHLWNKRELKPSFREQMEKGYDFTPNISCLLRKTLQTIWHETQNVPEIIPMLTTKLLHVVITTGIGWNFMIILNKSLLWSKMKCSSIL